MRRRQAVGLLLVAALLAGGRLVRQQLLVGVDDSWRDPLWLDNLLPPLPAPQPQKQQPVDPSSPLAINELPADSLLVLPGVGPVLAARIVAERTSQGRFTDASDLQRVKGIGPKLAERLSPYLIFGIESAASDSSGACGDLRSEIGQNPSNRAKSSSSNPESRR